ncbi:MAG: hypothetical protein ACREPQ_09825 [Rhodanobacter sp.]
MFHLTKHQVKIAGFNPRAEKHGDDNVLAGDLKLEAIVHSSVLDGFDKQLRKFLYRKPAQGEQVEMQFEQGDDLTARRVPKLSPFKWDEDFPGYKIELDSGLAVDETLKLSDVELSGFTFEAMDGGSVKITFRASFHPDGRTSGKLCQLIQETVELSLIAPAREEQQQAA